MRPPVMLKYQKPRGTTISLRRSETIHCQTKRIAKTVWAAHPNKVHHIAPVFHVPIAVSSFLAKHQTEQSAGIASTTRLRCAKKLMRLAIRDRQGAQVNKQYRARRRRIRLLAFLFDDAVSPNHVDLLRSGRTPRGSLLLNVLAQ